MVTLTLQSLKDGTVDVVEGGRDEVVDDSRAPDDCAVCLNPLGTNEEVEEEYQKLGCGHVFHGGCLAMWQQTCLKKALKVTCLPAAPKSTVAW